MQTATARATVIPFPALRPQIALPRFTLGQRVWAKFARLNKQNTLAEYQSECARMGGFDLEQCRIDSLLPLSAESYDAFTADFLEKDARIAALGGTDSDSPHKPDEAFNFGSEEQRQDWIAQSFRSVILVSAPGREPIVVDPQGANYARYVGLEVSTEPPLLREPGNPLGRWLTCRHRRGLAVILSVTPCRDGSCRYQLALFDEEGILQGRDECFSVEVERRDWFWHFGYPDYGKLTRSEIDTLDTRLRVMLEERRIARERKHQEGMARDAALKAEFARRKPEWAKSYIVAVERKDRSDSQSDYWGSSKHRVVFLAWSRSTRDGFAEMRKAAALFGPTAHLTKGPKDYEHREKWSMGHGYYLADGHYHGDLWIVQKRVTPPSGYDGTAFEWNDEEQ